MTFGQFLATQTMAELLDASDDDADVVGTDFDDVLVGGNGDDTLSGGAGNDSISGNDGSDRLDGGAGDDTLVGGQGRDTYIVDSLADIVDERGDPFNDIEQDTVRASISFDLSKTLGAVERLILTGTATEGRGNALHNTIEGNELANQLFGGKGMDTLKGEGGDDKLYGEDGDDYIYGGDGEDLIDGGLGNDELSGDLDDDVLFGGAGRDNLSGDEGNDTLNGDAGWDMLFGGNGNDTLRGGADNDELSGEAGNDFVYGDDGDDILAGGLGDDRLYGGAGNDELYGDGGTDRLFGGTGNDTYYLGAAGDIVTENANEGNDLVTSWVSFTLGANIESLTMVGAKTSGIGNALGNTMDGRFGVQVTLDGSGGNDLYHVDALDKVAEKLAGSAGGIDTVYAYATSFTLGANIENLILVSGYDGRYSGRGNALANTIKGTSSADSLYGAAGNDTLYGNAGSDSILGEDGNDTLKGGAGNDRMIGGNGRDILFGEGGTDRFEFDTVAQMGKGALRDIIADFSKTQKDRIDLASIDAKSRLATTPDAKNDAFSFLAKEGAGFTKVQGQLRFDQQIAAGKKITVVEGDINGDGKADFAIELTGHIALTKADFIL